MSECETPLLDLLRSVPADARLIYKHSLTRSQSIPVGTLAARCVAEWAALSQDNGKAEREIDRLTADYAAATHLLADRDAQIERLTAERDAANAEKKVLQESLASEKKWGELWYFVSDEEPLAFETIVTQHAPKRWIDQAYKLMAARALRKGTP